MKIEYYRGKAPAYKPGAQRIEDNWCWRLVAGNGRTIADGAEGYSKRSNVIRACKKMQKLMKAEWNGKDLVETPVPIVEVKP